jgi:hypothetical protein
MWNFFPRAQEGLVTLLEFCSRLWLSLARGLVPSGKRLYDVVIRSEICWEGIPGLTTSSVHDRSSSEGNCVGGVSLFITFRISRQIIHKNARFCVFVRTFVMNHHKGVPQ